MSDPLPSTALFRSPGEMRTVFGSAALLLTLILTLWLGWPRLADELTGLVSDDFRSSRSVQDFARMGKGHAPAACSDVAAQDALGDLVSRLAASEPRLAGVKVVAVDLPDINAYTLADRRIVVTSGLLQDVESGDELAMILGHELGHVLHDDDVREWLRGYPAGILARAIGPAFSIYLSAGNSLVGRAYSRDVEREADLAGVGLVKSAHIRADRAARFFARHLDTDQTAQALNLRSFLSTHPADAERINLMTGAELAQGEPALGDAAFDRVVRICGSAPPPREVADPRRALETEQMREQLRDSLHDMAAPVR